MRRAKSRHHQVQSKPFAEHAVQAGQRASKYHHARINASISGPKEMAGGLALAVVCLMVRGIASPQSTGM